MLQGVFDRDEFGRLVKAKNSLRKVWLHVKEELPHSARVKDALAPALRNLGVEVFVDQETPQSPLDLCLCLGGDGTLLSTIRKLGEARYTVPVLGIHTSGGLGFLHTLAAPRDHKNDLNWAAQLAQALVAGQWSVEPRWGLVGHVEDSKQFDGSEFWALNDVVVTKGPLSRMILLRLKVGSSTLFQRMRGDGLIVSTATGSTAYSLSAGGPVVQPTLNTLVVTPVCPHEVAQRPVVLDGNSEITIEILDHNSPSYLTCDGQTKVDVRPGVSEVRLQRAARPIRWVTFAAPGLESKDYFELLRSKLRYGGD